MAIEKYASLSEPQFRGGAKKVIYHNNKIYFVGAEGELDLPWWYWDITGDLYTFGINKMINLSQQYQIPPYICEIKPYQEDEIILGHRAGGYGEVTIFSEREGVKRRFVPPEILSNSITSIDCDDKNRIIAVGTRDGELGGLTIIQLGPSLLLSDVKAEPDTIYPYKDGPAGSSSETKISFKLVKPAKVTITAKGKSGERTLLKEQEYQTAGEYSIYFPGIVDFVEVVKEELAGKDKGTIISREDEVTIEVYAEEIGGTLRDRREVKVKVLWGK